MLPTSIKKASKKICFYDQIYIMQLPNAEHDLPCKSDRSIYRLLMCLSTLTARTAWSSLEHLSNILQATEITGRFAIDRWRDLLDTDWDHVILHKIHPTDFKFKLCMKTLYLYGELKNCCQHLFFLSMKWPESTKHTAYTVETLTHLMMSLEGRKLKQQLPSLQLQKLLTLLTWLG